MPVTVWTIENEQAGQRLDVFLAKQLNLPRSRAQKAAITALVNGTAGKASYTLRDGDRVAIEEAGDFAIPASTDMASTDPSATGANQTGANQTGANPMGATPAATELPPILYEDEHLIVLNKPRGLVVHPGAGEPKTTLVDILRVHGRQLSTIGSTERAGIVHRLDQETSGVMMVCKTDEAHARLAEDFAARRVEKRYTALVCGVPQPRGRIEAPIARHPVQRKKMAVASDGRLAITEYQVMKAWAKFALLEVDLLTGRTHQIRVHLSYIHHPVVGDDVYSGRKRALEAAPTPEVKAAIAALSGQALLAAKLSFEHPVTGERLTFYAPVPPEIQNIVDALDAATV